MRVAVLLALCLVGCASARPMPSVHAASGEAPSATDQELAPDDDDAPLPALAPSAGVVDTPERSRAPSTASYEQALSTPEKIDIHDDRVHLTDSQLRAPMHGIVNTCRVPAYAKVTIRTAVQNGRAVGVTVDVQYPHAKAAKTAKHPSPAAAKREAREAKAKKKVVKCLDQAVRDVVWPPSNRRDSFTTEF